MAFEDGDLMRAAVVWKLNGSDEIINVWHTAVVNPIGDEAEFLEDVAEYYANLYSVMRSEMANNAIHDRIELFNVTDGTPESWVGAVANLNGQATGTMIPSGASELVWVRTSRSRVIGKKYFGPLTVDSMGDGIWDAGAVAAMADIALKWGAPYVAVNGTGFRSGVWSETHNTFYLPISTGYTTTPAYQRRRKVGRGS